MTFNRLSIIGFLGRDAELKTTPSGTPYAILSVATKRSWKDADGNWRRTLMLSFTGGLKVFVALEPCDLRKSFDGLEGVVRERLREDPRTERSLCS